jgi:heat shock protein HtpX
MPRARFWQVARIRTGSRYRPPPHRPKLDPVTPVFVLTVLALIPAAFSWYNGRQIVALADDPVLPERLVANKGRNTLICAVCVAAMTPFGLARLFWTVPLLIVARMAVGYRIRKALYHDTWSFAGYLSFFARLIVAAYAFWIVLGSLPAIAQVAGSYDWLLAAALAVILYGWCTNYSRAFCAMLRARSIDDPAILTRFANLTRQCGLENVALKQVDMRGGTFANAVALPSRKHPTVLVSSTLLERLDAEETDGILAHELAHIEHHNQPGVLRAAARVTYALIVSGALVATVGRVGFPQATDAIFALWLITMVVTLVVRARDRQKHETESDLRALALTGNPEALVRGLTKLHAFARVPRRWDTEYERHASHPSLARRIQAILQAAGGAPASIDTASSTFLEAGGLRSVTFHDDRLEFNEGSAGSQSIGYGLLTALRIEVRPSAAPRLIAVDSSNRRWDLTLRPEDVARAQSTLDVVDGRLAAVKPPVISPAITRLLSIVALLLSIMAGQIALSLVVWLGVLRAEAQLLAAVGAGALGSALLIWRDHFAWSSEMEPWMAFGLFVCGATLIWMRAINRHQNTSRMTTLMTAALATAALIACGFTASSATDAMSLYQAARAWPAASVLSFALAGTLAFRPSRVVRCAAVPLACVGLGFVFVGSTMFREMFVHDPFLARAQPLSVTTVPSRQLTEFSLPFDATGLSLSPGGGYVAIASEDRREQVTIHAGAAGGSLTTFEADQAMFVEEGRLLLLERQRTGVVLRLIDLQSAAHEVWAKRVSMASGRLAVSPASGMWRLLGWDDEGNIASISGHVGEDAITEARWKSPASDTDEVEPLATSGPHLLAVENRSTYPGYGYGYGPSTTLGAARVALHTWAALMRSTSLSETRLWTIGPETETLFATSRLTVSCRNDGLDEPAICTAYDDMRTVFFAVDPAGPKMTPIGSLNGRFFARGDAGCGWILGWLDGGMVLVRPSTHEAIRLAGQDRRGLDHIAMIERMAAAVAPNPRGSTVRIYSFETGRPVANAE